LRFFFLCLTRPSDLYTLSLHDALPISILVAEIAFTMADFVTEMSVRRSLGDVYAGERVTHAVMGIVYGAMIAVLLPALSMWSQRSEEHTSELQSRFDLVCRLLLEKKKA